MSRMGISENHSIIPVIPGQLLTGEEAQFYREQVRRLCGLKNTNFPGSQPVSFGWRDIAKLKTEDYWVCEKSDGVRVLVLIFPSQGSQDVFLIDRRNQYYAVPGFVFPHYENPAKLLGASVLDGELVIDTDKSGGEPQQILRLLIFDCLVLDEENVMAKSLLKRTGRLKQYLFGPYEKMLSQFPHMRATMPFDIRLKSMQLSYHLQAVLEHDIPRLMHGNDGLIYTCASSGYVVGQDVRIMKWKPPSENSIDFKLTLRFPPLPNSSRPDFRAKPVFVLNAWAGRKNNDDYEFFDLLDVNDDEWEEMKASGEQFDDRVAEFAWQAKESRWRFLRFRDDKDHGNYIDVVYSICRSIMDGVEKADLIKHSQEIRDAWKERQRQESSRPAQLSGSGPPPPQSAVATSAPPLPSSSHNNGPPFSAGGSKLPPMPSGLAPSRWTRFSGPEEVHGFKR